MKTIILILLLIISMTTISSASTKDSIQELQKEFATVKKDVDTIKKDITQIKGKIAGNNVGKKKSTIACGSCDANHDCWEKAFILLPIILFVILAFVVFLIAKKAGVNFMQAMYAEDPEEIVKASPTLTDPNATVKTTLLGDDGKPVYYPSSSRLIAFLTALTTLVVIVCFVSYNAYCMMKCRPLPDFKNLFEIIAGLGLGIIPYSVNKLTSTPTK